MPATKVMANEDLSDRLCVVLTTVETREDAIQLGKNLRSEKVCACVQIDGPILSLFSWDGKESEETEWRLVIKTLKANLSQLEDCIETHHPYETPQIIALESLFVNGAYNDWALKNIKD